MFEKFWRDNLKEIQENKFRFAAICICFMLAVILFLTDDGGGEEIILTENPVEVAENVDAATKVIAVQNPVASNSNGNIKAVIGANSDILYVHDPFRVPPKEKIEPTPIAVEPPPVVQVPESPAEKFILRGTVIIGDSKSALIQKIIPDKNSAEENLILEIGDSLSNKKIIEINQDSLILEDGSKIFIDTN